MSNLYPNPSLIILGKNLALEIVRFLVLTQFNAAVMLISNITFILTLVPAFWGEKTLKIFSRLKKLTEGGECARQWSCDLFSAFGASLHPTLLATEAIYIAPLKDSICYWNIKLFHTVLGKNVVTWPLSVQIFFSLKLRKLKFLALKTKSEPSKLIYDFSSASKITSIRF